MFLTLVEHVQVPLLEVVPFVMDVVRAKRESRVELGALCFLRSLSAVDDNKVTEAFSFVGSGVLAMRRPCS